MNNKKTIGIIVAIIILAGIGFYFYKDQIMPTTVSSTDPNSADAQAEMLSLVAAVGNLIDLPQGENPTIATITDPEKLRDQPFFVNAKAGDKVLIYPTARKAFLYDPSREKLVEVAPLVLGDPSRVAESAPAASSSDEE